MWPARYKWGPLSFSRLFPPIRPGVRPSYVIFCNPGLEAWSCCASTPLPGPSPPPPHRVTLEPASYKRMVQLGVGTCRNPGLRSKNINGGPSLAGVSQPLLSIRCCFSCPLQLCRVVARTRQPLEIAEKTSMSRGWVTSWTVHQAGKGL